MQDLGRPRYAALGVLAPACAELGAPAEGIAHEGGGPDRSTCRVERSPHPVRGSGRRASGGERGRQGAPDGCEGTGRRVRQEAEDEEGQPGRGRDLGERRRFHVHRRRLRDSEDAVRDGVVGRHDLTGRGVLRYAEQPARERDLDRAAVDEPVDARGGHPGKRGESGRERPGESRRHDERRARLGRGPAAGEEPVRQRGRGACGPDPGREHLDALRHGVGDPAAARGRLGAGRGAHEDHARLLRRKRHAKDESVTATTAPLARASARSPITIVMTRLKPNTPA